MAMARCMPVPESPTLAPITTGGRSPKPVTLMAPLVAWAIGSKHL